LSAPGVVVTKGTTPKKMAPFADVDASGELQAYVMPFQIRFLKTMC
jgi:hypothetical protein